MNGHARPRRGRGESLPEKVAQSLDAIYAAPDEAAWRQARARLTARLEQAVERVYYDRLSPTPVGPLWVAVTDRGLVAVEFDTSEAAFARRLARRLGLEPKRSKERTAEARRQLASYLRGERTAFALAVDLRHLTPFQRRVLGAARAIRRGSVATYGEVARRIGRPRSARAVGQALGSNPIPIVIPCHRVLASDGSLGGYSGRGGIRTKRRLLQLEGAAVG